MTQRGSEPRSTSGDGSAVVRIDLPSRPMYLCAVREFVGEVCRKQAFSDMQTSQIVLAVDEALANSIKHGYDSRPDGRIELTIEPFADSARGAGIRVTISDWGRQIEPCDIKGRDLDDIRPGGLGVHIIRRVMDEATYERVPGAGMRLTLVKHASSPPATGDGLTQDQGRCCGGETHD